MAKTRGRSPWPYKVEEKRVEMSDVARQSANDLREADKLISEAEIIASHMPTLAVVKTAKAQRLIANAIAGLEQIQRLLIEAKNPNE